eukprot:gene15763-18735_t
MSNGNGDNEGEENAANQPPYSMPKILDYLQSEWFNGA